MCYPRTPMYTPELGDLSLLMLILTTGVSSTLLHTQSIGPIRDIAGGKPIRPHITTQISQCRKKIDIINRSTHFYVHWRVYSRDRQKGRKSKSERQRAGDKVQSTHTLRAFCLQTSRAVTPIIMEMRKRPALMPSITPLPGSRGQ